MSPRIKHRFAKDSHGNIVIAKQAIKGLPYFNVITNAEMTLKRSDKVGRYCKSAHFSLIGEQTGEPSLESEEHRICKERIVSVLNYRIDNHIPLEFSWRCEHCDKIIRGDWIKRATSVICEYSGFNMVCRPDIALLDCNNRAFAVIEVIVTHAPEERVINFYEDNNITMIEIRVNRSSIENTILGDDYVLGKLEYPDCVRFFPCINFSCRDRYILHNLIENIRVKDESWIYWYNKYSFLISKLNISTFKVLSFYNLFEKESFSDVEDDEKYSCYGFVALLIPLFQRGYKYIAFDDEGCPTGDMEFLDDRFNQSVRTEINRLIKRLLYVKDQNRLGEWFHSTIESYIQQRIASQ